MALELASQISEVVIAPQFPLLNVAMLSVHVCVCHHSKNVTLETPAVMGTTTEAIASQLCSGCSCVQNKSSKMGVF